MIYMHHHHRTICTASWQLAMTIRISHLYAMIMSLLAIVTTALIPIGTVVAGRVSHETVLQALVPLFVPLEMSNHFFFLHEHSRVAVKTMEVLSEIIITNGTVTMYNNNMLCIYTTSLIAIVTRQNRVTVVPILLLLLLCTCSSNLGIGPIRILDSY